jgi:hypothetical protein
MTYDRYRAGELALSLMYLTLHEGSRVWKGYSWDILDHLFQQGLITDPRSKAKSVMLTPEGLARSRALFEQHLLPATPRLPVEDKAAGGSAREPSRAGKPSSLTDLQQAEARRLLEPVCRLPADPAVRARLMIGYRFEGPAIVLFESRPRFLRPDEWGEEAVAKFRYVASRRHWQLFCMHRDLKWHRYEILPEAESLAELVTEVRRDPTGIFWG